MSISHGVCFTFHWTDQSQIRATSAIAPAQTRRGLALARSEPPAQSPRNERITTTIEPTVGQKAAGIKGSA